MPKIQQYKWRALSQSHVALNNGSSLKIGIFEVGEGGLVTTQTIARIADGSGLTKSCGWCDGVSVGCVQCTSSETVELDCVTKTIKCVASTSGGGGITGDFNLGVDARPSSPSAGEAGA